MLSLDFSMVLFPVQAIVQMSQDDVRENTKQWIVVSGWWIDRGPKVMMRLLLLYSYPLAPSHYPLSSRPQQNPHDAGRHEVRQRTGDHGAKAQLCQIVPTTWRQRAETANLDSDRAEIGKSAQGKGGNRE